MVTVFLSAGTELDAYWIGASLRTTQARDVDPIDLTDDERVEVERTFRDIDDATA